MGHKRACPEGEALTATARPAPGAAAPRGTPYGAARPAGPAAAERTDPHARLGEVRPDLVDGYRAALPGARAAVLARLWGALGREPVPGLVGRARHGDRLTVTFAGGWTVTGPAAAAEAFAVAPDGFALAVAGLDEDGTREDGTREDRPEALVRGLGGVLGPHAERLAAELAGSVANLALARAAAPAPDHGPAFLRRLAGGGDPDPLAALEACAVDGHPLHPGCRTRTGMSTVDILWYAPEHRPQVTVDLVAVAHREVHLTGDWPGWLRDGDDVLVPVHPWQRRHLGLSAPRATMTSRPLMSLRTLSLVERPVHLKTAMDVQMTSAVRTVSPAAVHNGPVLSRFLRTVLPPGVALLDEPAAAALLVEGVPSRHRAVVLRRAPARRPGRLAVPFAVLSAPSPASGRALVTEAIAWSGRTPEEFVREVVRVTVPPLLALLDRGVALEAHGQNTLLVLDAGRPAGLCYRDLGGVRVSPARLRARGHTPPPLAGDLGTDDPQVLRDKLFAALLSTVVGELVATVAREYGLAPPALWRALPDLPPGPWPVKATTAMRLAGDPLVDLWARSGERP